MKRFSFGAVGILPAQPSLRDYVLFAFRPSDKSLGYFHLPLWGKNKKGTKVLF